MADCMTFPKTADEFIEQYSFKDDKQEYTNGSELIAVFRVKQMMEHYFAKDTNVPNWIPVTERLPEESGQYIVCCDDSGCPYGEGIWYQSGVVVCANVDVGVHGGICWEWWEGSTLYDLEGVVTHWMPLPEPPKEG